MRFVFSFSKSISYDCNFSWKRAEDENRWRRYNRSGKFINEPAASDWQNVTKAQNNIGSHFVEKSFWQQGKAGEGICCYQVAQL